MEDEGVLVPRCHLLLPPFFQPHRSCSNVQLSASAAQSKASASRAASNRQDTIVRFNSIASRSSHAYYM